MSDKTIVLITGANSGIGYISAKMIAETSSKYHVILTGRDLQKVEAAKKELEALGEIKGTFSALQLEVTCDKSIAAAAKKVEEQFGRVDVLINNAGITGYESDSLKSQIETVMATNVAGPLLVSTAFMPLVEKSQNPYVLYITSGLGSLDMTENTPHYKHANWQVYRISKAALDMIALTEHNKWSPKGIKVFAVCPGLVRSNLRGKTEDKIAAGGNAQDPEVSGRLMVSIVEGRRDADVGKLVHNRNGVEGVYPW